MHYDARGDTMAKKKDNLEDKLSMKRESMWLTLKKKDIKEAMKFAEEYKKFLKEAKTERETVEYLLTIAEKYGFKDLSKNNQLVPGDKFYVVNREKALALGVVGKKPLDGFRLVVSHIDAPRIDVKPNPLWEDADSSLALLKTHYYGGIKKYQWVSRPLAIHGIVYTKDGKRINLRIGEDPRDPVFVIPDLLPHLARKVQGERKLFDGIRGEELQLVVGNIPIEDKEIKQKVKMHVLQYLNEKYGIVEEDFNSADLEIVPAEDPRDVGFDRGLVGAYGQDDRICAYTSFRAILEVKNPTYTSIAFFYDKEEIGSDGNVGAQSNFLEYVLAKVLAMIKPNYTYPEFLEILYRTKAISADVSAAINPIFKSVHDVQNAAKAGYGVVISKYTGHGGKYGSSEATAEFMHEILTLFQNNKVPYQLAELGKVDEGGGGTIAKFFAKYGMDVVDMGPGVIGMHSPFELVSKMDVWSSYLAYKVFLSQ
ncbi:aspartyl aminopeptidase [Aciduliprofundum sp. MAR08-339]|nr:aspartyl aminopeptidase [Aciduliprofundum sp. MAR08-339]